MCGVQVDRFLDSNGQYDGWSANNKVRRRRTKITGVHAGESGFHSMVSTARGICSPCATCKANRHDSGCRDMCSQRARPYCSDSFVMPCARSREYFWTGKVEYCTIVESIGIVVVDAIRVACVMMRSRHSEFFKTALYSIKLDYLACATLLVRSHTMIGPAHSLAPLQAGALSPSARRCVSG